MTANRRAIRLLGACQWPTDSPAGADDAPPDYVHSPEKATLIGTLAHLWPYIWPGDRADLKMRVVWSMVLLLVAKLATLSVPFTFKWAIDALTGAAARRWRRRTGRCG